MKKLTVREKDNILNKVEGILCTLTPSANNPVAILFYSYILSVVAYVLVRNGRNSWMLPTAIGIWVFTGGWTLVFLVGLAVVVFALVLSFLDRINWLPKKEQKED